MLTLPCAAIACRFFLPMTVAALSVSLSNPLSCVNSSNKDSVSTKPDDGSAERIALLSAQRARAPFKPFNRPCRLRVPSIASTNAPCWLQQRVQPFTLQHTRHQNHISIHLTIVQIIDKQSVDTLFACSQTQWIYTTLTGRSPRLSSTALQRTP